MKALILGAGYGNRLVDGLVDLDDNLRAVYSPLVKGIPKPLVKIAGVPLVNYLLNKIERETSISEVYIVSNSLFLDQFCKWRKNYRTTLDIVVIDNGNHSYGTGNGVIHDMHCGVLKGNIDDNILLLAGDTLFDMNFGNLLCHFNTKGENVIAVYREAWENMSRRGCVIRDESSGLVTDFIEKPQSQVSSNLAATLSYILTKRTLATLESALAPPYYKEMNFIQWSIKTGSNKFYTFDYPRRYDVGKIEDLIALDREYKKRLANF